MVLCTTADVITREVLFEGLSIDRRLRHRKRLDNLRMEATVHLYLKATMRNEGFRGTEV